VLKNLRNQRAMEGGEMQNKLRREEESRAGAYGTSQHGLDKL